MTCTNHCENNKSSLKHENFKQIEKELWLSVKFFSITSTNILLQIPYYFETVEVNFSDVIKRVPIEPQ